MENTVCLHSPIFKSEALIELTRFGKEKINTEVAQRDLENISKITMEALNK